MLETILHIILPIPLPPSFISSWTEDYLQKVLDAASLLDIPYVFRYVLPFLLEDARKKTTHESALPALRVFTIACRYSFIEEAREAAQICLRGRIHGIDTTESEHNNASPHLRVLYKYQERVAKMVQNEINFTKAHPDTDELRFTCTNATCVNPCMSVSFNCNSVHVARWRTWWTEFESRAKPLLQIAPLSGEAFVDEHRRADDVFVAMGICEQCGSPADIASTVFLMQVRACLDKRAAVVSPNDPV